MLRLLYLDICGNGRLVVETSHGKRMQKDLEIITSKLNALEASSSDHFQRSMVGAIKGLAENQKQIITEFEHLKKAIDLLTLQIFKVEKRLES
ncbi:MAG TPA: hypothetical protein VJ792_01615 [Candidatus Nitrosotalea sp.]|nr:hypothetical protein [Candidatus Nitrosotalea sp.]